MTTPESLSNYPVQVEIKNWADNTAKPKLVKKTTVKTYIVDAAKGPVANTYYSICDYEPKRIRMFVIVVDAAIALITESPIASPDGSTVGVAPQGAYLPPTPVGWEFLGPDAFWINSLGVATRVTVIKEYC